MADNQTGSKPNEPRGFAGIVLLVSPESGSAIGEKATARLAQKLKQDSDLAGEKQKNQKRRPRENEIKTTNNYKLIGGGAIVTLLIIAYLTVFFGTRIGGSWKPPKLQTDSTEIRADSGSNEPDSGQEEHEILNDDDGDDYSDVDNEQEEENPFEKFAKEIDEDEENPFDKFVKEIDKDEENPFDKFVKDGGEKKNPFDKFKEKTGSVLEFVSQMPPVGKNYRLNEFQIRFCLAAEIRLEQLRSFDLQYSDNAIKRFNEKVKIWNDRCTSYQYYKADLENAQRYVKMKRGYLEAEATRIYNEWIGKEKKENTIESNKYIYTENGVSINKCQIEILREFPLECEGNWWSWRLSAAAVSEWNYLLSDKNRAFIQELCIWRGRESDIEMNECFTREIENRAGRQ